jgi:hypothetical protein
MPAGGLDPSGLVVRPSSWTPGAVHNRVHIYFPVSHNSFKLLVPETDLRKEHLPLIQMR